MGLALGNRLKNEFRFKEMHSIGNGLNSDPILIIKLPDSRVLRIISRSFFLAIILLALPSIGPFMNGSSNESDMDSYLRMLPVMFPDLFDEGLIRRGHKGLIIGSAMDETRKDLEFLSDNGIDVAIESNLDVIPNEAFNFVLGLKFKSINSVHRVLKTDGIVITEMNNEPLVLLQKLPGYRIVYIRRFQRTMVAMRKSSLKDSLAAGPTENSKLCARRREARKMALKGLEDALLEPPPRASPRRALLKSMNRPIQIRFLPDLLGDSLAGYGHRIFISDDKNGGTEEWFYKNYPTRNQHFETYEWDVEEYDDGSRIEEAAPIGVSDWLRSNVGEEDFVVMKAEAKVVEEMMKDKTICLVDELFMKCKNQWEDDNDDDEEEARESKRAYWQCLALYGNLRDQGIAVHQWWS